MYLWIVNNRLHGPSRDSTYPLEAAPALMGFPMRILLYGTPANELISRTEVEGQLDAPESKTSDCRHQPNSRQDTQQVRVRTLQSSYTP